MLEYIYIYWSYLISLKKKEKKNIMRGDLLPLTTFLSQEEEFLRMLALQENSWLRNSFHAMEETSD